MRKIKICLMSLLLMCAVNFGLLGLVAQADENDSEAVKLRIVKVQLREASDVKKQFVVIKNLGAEADLSQLSLQLMQNDNLNKTVSFGDQKLLPGQLLVLVNNLTALSEYFAQPVTSEGMLDDGLLVKCFDGCSSGRGFLSVNQSDRHELRIVTNTSQIIDSFKYRFKDSSGWHYFTKDFLSLTMTEDGAIGEWASYESLKEGTVWLKINQFPLAIDDSPACAENQEIIAGECVEKCSIDQIRDPLTQQCQAKLPSCDDDQELIDNKCYKKCDDGYERNPETKRCNKIIAPVEPKTCDEGYVLNPETKRCNKIKAEAEPKTCPEGSRLNPATNRCVKIPVDDVLKICPAGYFLNISTNRCNKIPTVNEAKACPEGQYRHPETGRCRKVVLEEDCQAGYELVGNKCYKACEAGYERNLATNRCQKIATFCQEGFTKDPKTGICVKTLGEAPAQLTSSVDAAKAYNFDWLKILNSPVSGAAVASLIFVVYDKFFRKK